MVQLVNSPYKDICDFVDLFLSGLPIANIDSIPNAGKECLVVT